MKKTKKALASLAIAGMTLSMIPFNVFAASPVNRIAGVTAEQTAVQIAEQTGYTGTAILASSTSYGMVDALTAGPLAASIKAPILLTGAGSSLDAATKAELTKLAVKKVYVTSGTAVIKQSVIDELKGMGIEVEALGGFDRAETSVNIAKKMTGVTKVAVANTVVDALSIAAVASAANEPILLTDRDALPASVAAYLASAGVTASDVIGGTGVISDAVAAKLPSAARHAGMSAYDTNNKVIQDFAGSLKFDTVYVANGVTGIDALAGAPLAAQTQSPIVLTDGKTVPAAAGFTYSKAPVGGVVTALGGEFVVPENVRAGVAAGAVTPDTNELKIVSVSALTTDGHVLAVTFNKEPGVINKADVKVYASSSLSRVGVESVEVNGNVAEITLYDGEGTVEVTPQVNYTVEVKGVKFQFIRPGFKGADLDARVVKVNYSKKTMDIDYTGGTVTVNVPDNIKIDLQDALGREINVWYDADNDLTSFSYETNEIIYSGIEVNDTVTFDASNEVDNGEIEATETGETYEFADKPVMYLDGAKLTNAQITAALTEDLNVDFAKIVLNDNGDIAYISAYDWDSSVVDALNPENGNPLVVDEVDGTVLVGYDKDQDFEDYTIIKDGKVISLADIKQGDIVYYNTTKEFAEVYDRTVKGAIDEVFATDIEVNGELYEYENGNTTGNWVATYLDEDGDMVDFDEDAAKQMNEAGEEVVLHLDRDGNLVYVSGKLGDLVSTSDAALLTETLDYWADERDKSKMEIEYVDTNGDAQIESFLVADLDKVTIDGTTYEVDKLANGTKVDKFDLSGANSDGQYVYALDKNGDVINLTGATGVMDRATLEAPHANIAQYRAFNLASATFGTALKVAKDDDGNVVELEFITDKGDIATVGSFDSDDKYFDGKKINADTKVFNIEDADFGGAAATPANLDDVDADEVTVMDWSELADDTTISAGTAYYNEDNEVEYFVVTNDSQDSTSTSKALINKSIENIDDEIVEVEAFVDGSKKTYKVDKVDVAGVAKGVPVILTIDDNSGVVTDITVIANEEVAGAGMTVADDNVNIFTNVEFLDYDPVNDTIEFTAAAGTDVATAYAGTVKLDILSSAKVYDFSSSTIKTVSFSELAKIENDSDSRQITVVLDETNTKFVKFVVITNE